MGEAVIVLYMRVNVLSAKLSPSSSTRPTPRRPSEIARPAKARTGEPHPHRRSPVSAIRIIHSVAFRRLKEKTQVFVAHEGDTYRTRLTHSLEVAQIARSIAKALGLDDDLAEGVALAHDLGHPPFGHSGEDELDLRMSAYCGFDHNAQTFRVVTALEKRYPQFHGLNLTWETLEGVIKHNGPISHRLDDPSWKWVADFMPMDLRPDTWSVRRSPGRRHLRRHRLQQPRRRRRHPGRPVRHRGRAGRGADRSDDRQRPPRLPGPGRQDAAPGGRAPDDRPHGRRRSGGDAAQGRRPGNRLEEVRMAGQAVVAFSPQMAEDLSELRQFLHTRMYRHFRLNRIRSQARRILAEMFALFMEEPGVLPTEWSSQLEGKDQTGRARGYLRLHRRDDRPFRDRGTSQAVPDRDLELTRRRHGPNACG